MEKEFSIKIGVRWADLDPNFHMLHSKYYDYGATCRMEFLINHGLTPQWMMQNQVGPILFKEQCHFKREVHFGDEISIDLQLIAARKDFSRWSFRHVIKKNGTTTAAIIEVEGAWMDLVKRKLTFPPVLVTGTFSEIPMAEDFKWLD